MQRIKLTIYNDVCIYSHVKRYITIETVTFSQRSFKRINYPSRNHQGAEAAVGWVLAQQEVGWALAQQEVGWALAQQEIGWVLAQQSLDLGYS